MPSALLQALRNESSTFHCLSATRVYLPFTAILGYLHVPFVLGPLEIFFVGICMLSNVWQAESRIYGQHPRPIKDKFSTKL